MGKKRTGVRAASASSIRISFTYQEQECRELIPSSPTESNLETTLIWRNEELLPAIRKGTFDYATWFPNSPKRFRFSATPSIQFKQYLTDWFEDHKHTYADSSLEKNQLIIDNQLIPAFGKYPVAELKWLYIKKWIKKQKNTTKTLSNKLTLLNQALDEAVDDEIISVNPLYGKKFNGKVLSKKAEVIDPFSTKEIRLILNSCDSQIHNLFTLAFFTGLRISEYIALTWNDIDWANNRLSVNKAMTQAAKVVGLPKTSTSYRWVKLTEDVITALKDQKQYTYLQGQEIFHNPRLNKPWKGDQAIRKTAWTPTLKKAEISYRYPYQTRHTFASLAITSGENIGWVSKQMGHKDAGFTYRTYARFIDEDAPEAGNKFASLISPKSELKIASK